MIHGWIMVTFSPHFWTDPISVLTALKPGGAAAVTLSPVFFSVVDRLNTQNQEEYKQFTSLIQVATNAKADQSQRVGAIWLLERYWKPDYEEVLANVLSSLIGNGRKNVQG
jgi:hypothetical protein